MDAASDLHAADAKYLVQCYKSFAVTRNVESASSSRSCSVVSNTDDALEEVISAIRLNPEKIWSSGEVHTLYIKMGRNESNRHRFISRLKQNMENEITFLTSPGTAAIIMSKD